MWIIDTDLSNMWMDGWMDHERIFYEKIANRYIMLLLQMLI
jgi:hypothetical protein